MSALNKKNFQLFMNQARGAEVTELHVDLHERKNGVVLQYNGRSPKKKTRLTGEWSISRTNKDDAALKAEIKEFLDMARQHFFVRRGEGLSDESYSDADMEAESKPITKDE